jgi:hypothetical protein
MHKFSQIGMVIIWNEKQLPEIEISFLGNFMVYILNNLFFLFILKVANIRCLILIAVEIFHYIIRK